MDARSLKNKILKKYFTVIATFMVITSVLIGYKIYVSVRYNTSEDLMICCDKIEKLAWSVAGRIAYYQSDPLHPKDKLPTLAELPTVAALSDDIDLGDTKLNATITISGTVKFPKIIVIPNNCECIHGKTFVLHMTGYLRDIKWQ